MNRLIAVLLCCCGCGSRVRSVFHRGYLKNRLHPDVIHERDMEGVEAQIVQGKLVLHVDDFVGCC